MKQKLVFLAALLTAISVFSAEYFVDAARPDDTGAATNWATAKKTIQAAVDLTIGGDTVWVTNGTYILTSEISVTNAITIRSINGPNVTVVSGNLSNRCFALSNACLVSGLTIKNGRAWEGGGVYCPSGSSVVSNCVVTGNGATYGGGVFRGRVENCKVFNNYASAGGGLCYVSACNSLVYSNNATTGGGAYYGTLVNCTVAGNKAYHLGCGVYGSNIKNCIVWGNRYDIYSVDVAYATVSSSCIPVVYQGTCGDDKNITSDPLLSASFHVVDTSPCRGSGSSKYVTGVDLDGISWLSPPSMGCYEVHSPISMNFTGPTKICVGVKGSYEATIIGPVETTTCALGDGQVITNTAQFVKAWSVAGNYEVVLSGDGPDYPQGLSFTQVVSVVSLDDSAVYVSTESGDDLSSGRSWAEPKKTIQAGIDAQDYYWGLILISNGVYSVASEIIVDKQIIVRSANGVGTVFVDGGASNRCFNLGDTACVLAGLTITNGYSADNGGGIYCSSTTPIVSNCVFTGNSSANWGGGMYMGTAFNCIFMSNQAAYGGGKNDGKAYNSFFKGNSGGGVYGGELDHCTIIYNNGRGGSYLKAVNSIFCYNDSDLHVAYPDDIIACFVGGDPKIDSDGRLGIDSPCRGAGLFNAASIADFDGEPWLNPPSVGYDELHGEILINIISRTNVCANTPVPISVSIIGSKYLNTIDFGDGTLVSNVTELSKVWMQPGFYEVTCCVFNDDYPEGVSAVHRVQVFSQEGTEIYVSASTGDDSLDGTSWANAKASIQAGVDAQKLFGGVILVSNGVYALNGRILVSNAVKVVAGDDPTETVVDAGGNGRAFTLIGEGSTLAGMTIVNGVVDSYPVYGSYGGGVFCDDGNHIITNCIIVGNYSCYSAGGVYGGTLYDSVVAGNWADQGYGGGTFESTAYRCVIEGNVSLNYFGGGMYKGCAENCLIFDNQAGAEGGGIFEGAAVNCTIVNNWALIGGGVYSTAIENSILYNNTASWWGANYEQAMPDNSCCPDVTHGVRGNVTNSPLFVDEENDNFRLRDSSPCINAGNNNDVATKQDLIGNPRIVGSVVDMGAYENQDAGTDADNDGMDDLWELNRFGGRHFADPDTVCSNGVNTLWQAYIAGLNPNDPTDIFQTAVSRGLSSENVLRWNATSGRVYAVYYSTNLISGFQPLETNIPWAAGCFTDSVHNANGQLFYKIDVRLEN